MEIYVARHGQTQWNLDYRVCGRTDIPLTQVGLEQAEALAEKVEKTLCVDVIIASPMLRAQQTAQAVARRLGMEIVTEERLIEQDFGIFEGADRNDPGFLENKRHFGCRFPGGESMMDVAHRIYSLLEDIKLRYEGKTVLLVCHGSVSRAIRTYFKDMTNEEYFHYLPDNGELTGYEY